jgi:ADP-ribose pyrophosphatase YjhB (NUDIX family)
MSAKNHYTNYTPVYLALDCIVFGFDNEKLKLLLIKRNFKPFKGSWSLMGGFLEPKESIDESARRILLSLTGLSDVFLEQLQVFGAVNRDTEARVVSSTYYALIKINDYDHDIVKANGAAWHEVGKIPQLIFDHNEIVETALNKLRRKCRTQPIGFELLPEKFTIPQLQNLYEAILDKTFDKRNFRKKLLSMNLLDKLEEKDRAGSKKGAFYYQFNRERYEVLSLQGFNFEL